MSWRDSMRPASFRGVPFFVENAEFSGGRRTVTHEYPSAFGTTREPFVEDMGRKARTFTAEGYVLGAEYLTAKERLIDALEKEGPGELVHPYYGTLRVAVSSFRVRETARDGGYAEFSFEFAETPSSASQPASVLDTVSKVFTSAAAARSASSAEFLTSYSPGSLLASVGDSLRSAMLAINSALATVQVEAQLLATLKAQIADVEGSVTALINVPADLATALVNLFDLIESRVALLALYAFNPGTRPPDTTANRIQERACFDALQYLVQRLALLKAAEIAVDETFDSYETALAARTALTDLLDDQAETATDDTFPSLLQLRADLVKAIPSDGLPRLVAHTPPVTVPSLVLAFRLYGDLTREGDLLTRNRVSNPCFIRGGRALEVLSDECPSAEHQRLGLFRLGAGQSHTRDRRSLRKLRA